MSRTPFYAANASAGTLTPLSAISRSSVQKTVLARAQSGEDVGAHGFHKSAKAVPATRTHSKRLPLGSVEHGRPVSRVELLLQQAPKAPKPVYSPLEDTAAAAQVNKAIKLAQHASDVRAAVNAAVTLSASNIAFAIYRLGCIFTFASRYRQQELLKSGFVDDLLERMQHKVHLLDAGSVTLLLDGCARLDAAPAEKLLMPVANLVHGFAPVFEASQLPLVLWAFGRLNFKPRRSIVGVLEAAAVRTAAAMSPQGLVLTLRGFQAQGYSLSQRCLARIADSMYRQLPQFKPSEVAMAVDAFAAFPDFKMPLQLVLAIARCTGQSLHSNIVSGKPSLSRASSLEAAEPASRRRTDAAPAGRSASPLAAAAGQIMRHVSARVGELDDALSAPSGAAIAGHTLRLP